MRSLESPDKRVGLPRKTIPKGRGVRSAKARLDRNASMKASSARKAGFRSNIELSVARSLKTKGIPYEYENTKLTYIPKPRTYTPDFYLPEQDIFVEVKGYFDKGDRVKMQLIKEQFPEHDIRILFLNARNKIYKGSKTTYAAWAERHGFKWAEGSIPEEWLKNDRD